MIDTAIILAGGLGTRLRPLTDNTPKPLLPLKGKPVVQHIMENLQQHGVKNIILSIGYKAELVQHHFGNGSKLGLNITYSLEHKPLGTGGAVLQAAKGLTKPFLLLWGDNLMSINLTTMYQQYVQQPTAILMALTPRKDVENFGVAKLDRNKITFFVYKPKREDAPSNLINAGAFIINPDCLSILPPGESSMDYDCFEKLAARGEITAYIHEGQWFPTDTIEKYSLACQEFDSKINFSEKKVIIADVDGTICHSCQEITPEMSAQVQRLISKGYTFAFMSGTDTNALYSMISTRLTAQHHLLGNSGTSYDIVEKNKSVKNVYNYALLVDEKKEIIASFEKLIAEFNIHSLTTREDQILDRGSQITLSAIGRNAPRELKEKFDPDGGKRKVWVEFLKKHVDETKYDLKIGGTTSIDITHKGKDKGWGVLQFSKHHNIPLAQMLFLGDKIYPGGNDYSVSSIIDCISVKNPEETLVRLREL